MNTERVARVYYRSLTADGRLWCESRSAEEVKRMSEGKQVTYQRMVVMEYTNGWEDADPAQWPANCPCPTCR